MSNVLWPRKKIAIERRLVMFARTTLFAVVVCFIGSSASFGQVMYGGYNLGPDYGAMVNQMVAQQNHTVAQATARGEEAILWAMNNPQCAEMYRQHQMQGGQLSYRDFSMQFAGTGGFTPAGKAHYFNVGQINTALERHAWNGYQGALGGSTAAMQDWHNGWSDIQHDRGLLLSDPGY
jgi:hypothetical protein